MQIQLGAFLSMGCLNKLLIALVIPMIMGSGAVVATELNKETKGFTYSGFVPDTVSFDFAYLCLTVEAQASISNLPKSEKHAKRRARGLYLNFMKDGGFIMETDEHGVLGGTYGPVTYPSTYLNWGASTGELFYTDLGGFHKFVLSKSQPDSSPFTLTLMLDKDVMIGTWAKSKTSKDGVVTKDKGGMGCEQLYPSVD